MPPAVSASFPLSDADALAAAEAGPAEIEALVRAAGTLRDQAYGARLTFSPKVFLPLTNLCRNRCDYCSFRKSPGDVGAWTMTQREVLDSLAAARATGCAEALFCLGDKPEKAFSAYRVTLAERGHTSTVEYLEWGAEQALASGLLPHTNAGVLTADEMARLRKCNVSLGLMLENISPRLCEKGMPHHRAPDKRPSVRMRSGHGQLEGASSGAFRRRRLMIARMKSGSMFHSRALAQSRAARRLVRRRPARRQPARHQP